MSSLFVLLPLQWPPLFFLSLTTITSGMPFPEFDPVAFHVFGFAVHWYGMMYLLGFVGAWWLLRRRARQPGSVWTEAIIDDVLFYSAMGVILGGRIGYMLFYNTEQLLSSPLSLLRIWEGGMSFHGGLLGVLLANWLYARKLKWHFFTLTDFIAPVVPIGLGAGRIGNFINGELWGRVTDVPWGMVFPHGGPLPRHPSQLYQACLEGLVLFILLWGFSAKQRPRMAVSGLFLLAYGVFRFAVEFVRQPDPQLGAIAFDWLTMGQLLSLPMVVLGVVLLLLAYRRQTERSS